MPEEQTENLVRRIPWIAVAMVLLIPSGFFALSVMESFGLGLSPCFFKALTGLPCATCGSTRMAQSFAAGDLARAFHWHPVGALVLLSLPLAALWDLRRAWRGQAYPELPDSWVLRIAVILLFLVTWLLQAVRGI